MEEILITLTDQYHMLRPLGSDPAVLLYLVLDPDTASLAMARRSLLLIEAGLVV